MIREATEADVSAIARVHVASWRETYAGIVPQAYLDGIRVEDWEARRRRHHGAPGTHTRVGVAAGVVVAFAIGGASRDSTLPFAGEGFAIYVRRTHQGAGLGLGLFGAVATRLLADGHGSLVVWVLRDNPARRFYERLGGVLVGEKAIEIGGAALVEVAYGWPELARATARWWMEVHSR